MANKVLIWAVLASLIVGLGAGWALRPPGVSPADVAALNSKLSLAQAAQTQVDHLKSELAHAGGNLTVDQVPGKLVYWVLPGKRALDPAVFGTPSAPRATGAEQIAAAQGKVKALLEKFPFLVGVPVDMRETSGDGANYTTTSVPTLFSDKAAIVRGQLNLTYEDRQPWDTGKPLQTQDAAELNVSFRDPAGNDYRIELGHILQPPFPGTETGGGVILNAWHHGAAGPGSPLMPRAFTYGALWAEGDLILNGKVVAENQVFHVMTTQTVRDKNYRLVFEKDLPLPLDDTPAGQTHHTHVVMFPIKATPTGPEFNPVPTAFKLPNGQFQPFIHVMFEQDVVENGPFADDLTTSLPVTGGGGASGAPAGAVHVATGEGADQFHFDPAAITVTAGSGVTVVFENRGTAAHNWGVDFNGDGKPDVRTHTIQPGETDAVAFTAPAAGDYPFFCDIPGHREAGLLGTLHVVP